MGNIYTLQWEDIDLNNGIFKINKTCQRIYNIQDDQLLNTYLTITVPKTANAIRDIPISTELVKILKPLKKKNFSNFFLLTNREKPVEPRTYRKYYDNLLLKLKIKKIKFHGLRHTFATRCVETSHDYKSISSLLGHSDIKTTLNLYTHSTYEQKKKCIQQMLKKFN